MRTYYAKYDFANRRVVVKSTIDAITKGGCHEYYTIRAKTAAEAYIKAGKLNLHRV